MYYNLQWEIMWYIRWWTNYNNSEVVAVLSSLIVIYLF